MRFGLAIGSETTAVSVGTVSGKTGMTLECVNDCDADDDAWEWSVVSWCDDDVCISSLIWAGNGKMVLLKTSEADEMGLSWNGKMFSWKTTFLETETQLDTICRTLYPL